MYAEPLQVHEDETTKVWLRQTTKVDAQKRREILRLRSATLAGSRTLRSEGVILFRETRISSCNSILFSIDFRAKSKKSQALRMTP